MAKALNVVVTAVNKDSVVCVDKEGRAVTIQLNRHEGADWKVGTKLRVGAPPRKK